MSMELCKLVIRNLGRHPLRSVLTALGVAVALFAFSIIRVIIAGWYSGVEATSKNRLVVRNAVSLVFDLPLAYRDTIAGVPGVEKLGYGNWFGGIYKEKKYNSSQFAIDDNYFDMLPEYILFQEKKEGWRSNRKGILVGEEFAKEFEIKEGDTIQLQGTIFPGLWEFQVSGIFKGRNEITDTRVLFFHWDYLNERNKAEIHRSPDRVGFYLIQLVPGASPAEVSRAVDKEFANSFAETLTETETAFVQGFISMSSAIIAAMNAISAVVIVIMLLVLANTMLMSFRERYHEYSVLKSFGFENGQLGAVILGESAVMCGAALIILLILLAPVHLLPPRVLLGSLASFFPVLKVPLTTLLAVMGLLVLVATLSSAIPFIELVRLKVSDGLRKLA
jgi:putative ABC transport system permease protein